MPVFSYSPGPTSPQSSTTNESIVTVNVAAKTLGLNDAGTVQHCTFSTGPLTLTIPLNSAVAFPVGTRIIIQYVSQPITLASTSGVSITDQAGSSVSSLIVSGVLLLRKIGADAWIAAVDQPSNPLLSSIGNIAAGSLGLVEKTGASASTVTSVSATGRSILQGTAVDGRSALGLGTMATQSESAVSITGGTIQGVSTGNTASVDGNATLARGVWIGVHSNTPRAIFSDGSAAAWTIDSEFGNFRWYTPNVIRLLLRSSDSLLQAYGPIAAKVYTPATRPSASSLPAGTYIFIFDATFTPSTFIAYTDQTNWYRVSGTTILP